MKQLYEKIEDLVGESQECQTFVHSIASDLLKEAKIRYQPRPDDDDIPAFDLRGHWSQLRNTHVDNFLVKDSVEFTLLPWNIVLEALVCEIKSFFPVIASGLGAHIPGNWTAKPKNLNKNNKGENLESLVGKGFKTPGEYCCGGEFPYPIEGDGMMILIWDSEMYAEYTIKNGCQITPAITYIDKRLSEIPGITKDKERLIDWKNKLQNLRTKLIKPQPAKRGRGAESNSAASDDDVASVASGAAAAAAPRRGRKPKAAKIETAKIEMKVIIVEKTWLGKGKNIDEMLDAVSRVTDLTKYTASWLKDALNSSDANFEMFNNAIKINNGMTAEKIKAIPDMLPDN